nr:hypothetical protein [uncultured Mucilaginibacter sp.]
MNQLKSVIYSFLIIISMVVTARGQQHTNATPQQIMIDGKGGIYSHDGTKLGYIDRDNVARNNAGNRVYSIDKNGNIVDRQGKKLGKASKNGVYYSVAGESILTVKDLDAEKCAILDPKGHNYGTVHKNYKLHACAAHCFFLEKAAKK